MSVPRRLLIVAAIAAVACSAAFVAGSALSDTSTASQPPTARSAASPTPTASVTGTATPPRRPLRAHRPRMEAGPRLLGRGDTGDRVRDLQARLRQIAWFTGDVTGTYGEVTTTAVRGFQAKRGIPATGYVDQRTLDRLAAMTDEPTLAELHNRANAPVALDARCRVGRVLCVDKTSRALRLVVDGQVRQTLDVRFGASSTPTREGVFHVTSKSRDHVSTLYGSSMPFAMFFSRGQAVHYSSDFAARGYLGASHGCVNVRDYAGIAHLFDQVRVGDTVVVYWS